jgi:hypothetical protein
MHELVRQIEITSLNQVTLYDPNYLICMDKSKQVRQNPVFNIYTVDYGDIYWIDRKFKLQSRVT